MGKLSQLEFWRNNILLSEIGVLLHDLGKLSIKFNEKQAAASTVPFAHESICGQNPKHPDFLPADVRKILDTPCIHFSDPDLSSRLTSNCPVSLGHFINSKDLEAVSRRNLYQLRANCDHADSGGDKGLPSDYSKQSAPDFFDSTSFGIERNKLDPQRIEQALDNVCDVLRDFGGSLKDQFLDPHRQIVQTPIGVEAWFKQRHQLLSMVEDAFSLAIAETRRSGNDVSLWHHSYAVASLFKSLVAGKLINPEAQMNQWSILAVKFDVFSLLERAHKIGDIIGTVHFIQHQLCPAIKQIFEVEYPIGNEIYHDESGIYFTFPALNQNDQKNLLTEIKQAFEKDSTICDFDLQLSLSISQPSRFLVKIGPQVIGKGDLSAPVRIDGPMPKWTDIRRRSALCPVCQVREEVRRANLEQNICGTCLDRRDKRKRNWLEDLNPNSPTPTIWLSEVADGNRRIALISGQFGLSKWIDGTMIDSSFSNPLIDEQTPLGNQLQPRKYRENDEDLIMTYDGLINAIENYDRDNPPAFTEAMRSSDIKPKDLFTRRFFEDRNYRLKNQPEDPYKLAHLFTCKHPVASRLRRIWKATQDFWEITAQEILSGLGPKKRLILRPHMPPQGPRDGKVYEVKINGRRCSVIYLDQKFVVLESNIKINPEQIQALEWIDDSNQQNCIPCTVQERADQRHHYIPAITIHTSTLSFMAIVPAEDALPLIKQIRDEYEDQFGKVANRLPLYIGMTIFADIFPLYVVIDAARRMMDGFKRREESEKIADARWKVIGHPETIDSGKAVKLTLAKEDDENISIRHLKRIVSVELGDRQKTDVFYPYFILLDKTEDQLKQDQRRYFLWPDGQENFVPLIHVLDLEKDDVISHLESRFDFTYLDSIREITQLHYNSDGRRVQNTKFRGARDWGLHRIEEIEKLFNLLDENLTVTQIHALRETLVGTINRWWHLKNLEALKEDDVYPRFVKAVLQRAGDGKLWEQVSDKNEREWLVNCCVSGFLFDVLELYLAALKVEPSE